MTLIHTRPSKLNSSGTSQLRPTAQNLHFPSRPTPTKLNRQIRISRSTPDSPEPLCEQRSHHRQPLHEPGRRDEKIAKEDDDAVHFDYETDEGPAQKENEDDAGKKGDGAAQFLPAGEKGECAGYADDESEAEEEEDLRVMFNEKRRKG